MITITISECKTNGKTWTSTHRTEDAWEAAERAVKKHFGRSAHFERDCGISVGRGPADGTQYGQIGVPARLGGTNLITGRISIRAE
jgi:hypothetical protein